MAKRNRADRQSRRQQTLAEQQQRVERIPDPPDRLSPPEGTVVTQTTVYVGPFPDPESLRRYDDVVPGSAREIIDMGKAEQEHRHWCDIWEGVYGFFGMACGLAIGLSALGAGTYLGMNGQAVLGGTAMTLGLGTLAGAFLLGRRKPEEGRQSRRDASRTS